MKRIYHKTALLGFCLAGITAGYAERSGDAAGDLEVLQAIEAELQGGGSSAAGRLEQASDNATVNLVRLLVQRGVLTQEDSVLLIRQAEQEAAMARAQSDAVQAAAAEVRAAAEAELQLTQDEIRVTYVPESVKQEIVEDLSHNVMNRARRENWATPPADDWTSGISLFGDLRLRYEAISFPSGNSNTGAFPDFNAINTGSPFDIAGTQFAPQLNVDQDRNRFVLRARIGLEADLGDNLTLGFKMATGSGSSPVSTNQTLGSPGNFSKYQIWLDRAFLRWQTTGDYAFTVTAGRFDNPFFSSEIVWDNDIGFDGIALQLRTKLTDNVTGFLTGGAFPVFNTALNLPANQPAKFKSDDRYLFAIQGGIEFKPTSKIDVKLAAAYYHFEKVEGQLSSPFVPLTPDDAGDTDSRRPTFAQKGNTYMMLRDILPVPENNFGTEKQWQYFGLASPFQTVAFTGRVDFNHYEPFQVTLFGEVIRNLAFSQGDIDRIAVNNRSPDLPDGSLGAFSGGDMGWIAGINVGHATLEKRWDWRVGVDYRHMESDSFVDGFVGSDFGMGGTNVKGFTLGGTVALFPSVHMGLRWMSAAEITGPRMRSDIFQFDVSARF